MPDVWAMINIAINVHETVQNGIHDTLVGGC